MNEYKFIKQTVKSFMFFFKTSLRRKNNISLETNRNVLSV